MSDELKPCPFCGETHEPREINDHYGIFYALCCDYQIMVSWRSELSRRQAYAMWNTRPIEDALRARAEKAEGELKENAQKQLLRCMRDFSEETYCAGWLLGIEDACRALVAGELKNGFGMLEPGDELDEWKQKMTDLHDRAGGWWKWDDTENKEVFVPDRWIP